MPVISCPAVAAAKVRRRGVFGEGAVLGGTMKRNATIAAALLGLALLAVGILEANYRDLSIAGAILMAGALLAEPWPTRPS
jgi:hypothetical protein